MDYLNVFDLCKYIYKSESYVYKMVGKKQIPFHKVGNRLLFKKEEIINWVENGYFAEVSIPDVPKF